MTKVMTKRPAATDLISAGGKTQTLQQWAVDLGYTLPSLQNRISKVGAQAALTTRKPTLSARAAKGAGAWRTLLHGESQENLHRRRAAS